jgi:hypothetical protein
LRGDIKITEFLREIAASDDSTTLQRMKVFSSLFLTVTHYSPEQAANFASGQIRRISEEIGLDLTEGHEKFIEALGSGPTALFDTSVWTQRSL